MRKLLIRLVRDQKGGELLEYALIVGLIVAIIAGAISMMGHGPKVH